MSGTVTTKARLVELGQAHLFEGKSDAQVAELMAEINSLTYGGGIERYIAVGRELLGASSAPTTSAAGSSDAPAADPHTIARVDLPDAKLLVSIEDLSDASDKALVEAARSGAAAMRDNVFVMVAGGLGERLGYSSIKLGLPVETATNTSYIELYLRWAAACGRNPSWKAPTSPSAASAADNNKASAGPKQNPFLIMTSEDTHSLTIKHLEANAYFGYDPTSVVLMKQDTVPCLVDSTAKVALGKDGKLLRKPHGHGDVHQLIYGLRAAAAGYTSSSNGDSNSGALLIDALLAGPAGEQPYRSITFMQDTNGAATSTAPLSVHYLHKNDWAMAFTSVPRMPGEAIGIYCAQTMGDGSQRCGNIEYNLFSPIYAKSSGRDAEPLIEGTKYSVFPGSINTLVMGLDAYAAALHKGKGHVPEFINPKYTDSTKTSFKSPARVESLMQDIAFCFDFPRQKIGCTTFGRESFEPVKNALADGVAGAVDKGIAAACAATGEEAWLKMNRARLIAAGVAVETAGAPATAVVSPADPSKSISVTLFPIVAHDAGFINYNVADVIDRFPQPSRVSISARSTLVVKGNVVIKSLKLDGALVIDASAYPCSAAAAPVEIDGLEVSNEGWEATPLAQIADNRVAGALTEVDRIRGYVMTRRVTDVVTFSAKGVRTQTTNNTVSSL